MLLRSIRLPLYGARLWPQDLRSFLDVNTKWSCKKAPTRSFTIWSQCQPIRPSSSFQSFSSSLIARTIPPTWHVNSRSLTTASDSKISGIYFSKANLQVSVSQELTKAQISDQFEIQYRDLRDIDLKSESVTRILVRPATILVQFFDLCVIIQADEAMLINRGQQEGDDLNRVRMQQDGVIMDFQKILTSVNDPKLPYEFCVLEASLIAVLSHLRTELREAREEAEKSANQLTLEPSIAAVGLDQLYSRAQRLFSIEQKAELLRETIREVLNNDDDLAAMYLTDRLAGKPHATSDHQEAEYLLEAYHKAADSLAESASSSTSAMRKKEANFRAALAVQRNQIMFLEARISVYTLGLAAGTLIAGLFGMNLINYSEEAPYGFAVVTAACIFSSVLLSLYGGRKLSKLQSLKGIQLYSPGMTSRRSK